MSEEDPGDQWGRSRMSAGTQKGEELRGSQGWKDF